MKKHRILILSILLVFSLTALGFSATNTVLSATIASDMMLTVDQEKWQPMDTDGSDLYPVIIKGRSYLPVRALLDKFGIGVVYDDKTRTIKLTSALFDKATPKLAEILFDPKPDTAMSIEYSAEKLAALNHPKLTQLNSFELAETAEIWIDGTLSKVSVQDISFTKYASISSAKVDIDKTTGQVTKLELTTGDDSGSASQRGVIIRIEIKRPPLVITITIIF